MVDVNRPNILFILSDDQGPWALGAAGNKEVKTPNLDRLANSGMRFENFFCTSPVCSPARASIVTGRIPSQHGVHDWIRCGDTIEKYEPELKGRQIEYLAGQKGYMEFLAENGYTCGLSGKWHLGASHKVQKGHTYWRPHAKGGSNYYNAPMVAGEDVVEEEKYITDVFTDNALEFLEEIKREDNPFYLGVHYTAPHSPWGRNQHPSETFDDYFNNCPFDSVPNEIRHPWAKHFHMRDETARREALSGYYTAITEMDRNIGRLLDWLDANDKTNNTLVIFLSDNGFNMGHHGIYGKGNGTTPLNMFDESVKVPAIFSWPGQINGGQTASGMVSQYDIMPTILDIVNLENPKAEKLPGSSFLPILKNEAEEIREDVVVYDEYGPVRMVRTHEWKYVHRYPHGPHELYDLENDPGERYNLVTHKDYKEKLVEMRARLEGWFHKYTDPKIDGRAEGVTGAGQRCEPGIHAKGEQNYF